MVAGDERGQRRARRFAPLSGTSNPLTLLTYSTWIANDAVTIAIRAADRANEPLTAGSYSKTHHVHAVDHDTVS